MYLCERCYQKLQDAGHDVSYNYEKTARSGNECSECGATVIGHLRGIQKIDGDRVTEGSSLSDYLTQGGNR